MKKSSNKKDNINANENDKMENDKKNGHKTKRTIARRIAKKGIVFTSRE
jgi:hypothetical protein